MTKLRQAFTNSSSRPQFLFLEPNVSRYRLNPGETLILHYDGNKEPGFYNVAEEPRGRSCALSIDFINEGSSTTVVIWTWESDLFHTDGRPAVQDHDPAP